jgi:hypothetical protein
MCGVFAEFERAMIVERVNAGLKRAKAAGKVLGRPKTDAGTEASIRRAPAKGDKGILKIAAEFGVGSGTVQRIKAAMCCQRSERRCRRARLERSIDAVAIALQCGPFSLYRFTT